MLDKKGRLGIHSSFGMCLIKKTFFHDVSLTDIYIKKGGIKIGFQRNNRI